MNKIVLKLNYVIDGILTVIPTNMFYEQFDDEYIENIYFELDLGNSNIKSKGHATIEYAIKNLQKSLSSNCKIACCQSCKHGNFCPYGDNDDEIFCFKDITTNNKNDVCEFFSKNSVSNNERSRKLLDFCTEYKPISHDKYYTYNDWGLQ